jgi:hypothetical protein
MKRRRTDDPDISFIEADPVTLWSLGIVEWKVDTRRRKFRMTPIFRDGSEAPMRLRPTSVFRGKIASGDLGAVRCLLTKPKSTNA